MHRAWVRLRCPAPQVLGAVRRAPELERGAGSAGHARLGHTRLGRRSRAVHPGDCHGVAASLDHPAAFLSLPSTVPSSPAPRSRSFVHAARVRRGMAAFAREPPRGLRGLGLLNLLQVRPMRALPRPAPPRPPPPRAPRRRCGAAQRVLCPERFRIGR